jgi:ribose transport system substrate-binding protein
VRVLISIILLLGVAVSHPATVHAQEAAAPWRVGALYWSMQIPGQVAMREGLERRVAELQAQQAAAGGRSIELLPRVAGDGAEGIERQIVQMNELIDLKVDLIVVQPTDNAALAAPLVRANEAGIPVVAYDQYISKGELTSFLTSDNQQAGYLDGEYLAGLFADDRPIRLVLVEYPHVDSTVKRVDGLLEAFKDAGQPVEIIRSYEAVEPVGGKAAGEAILRDFPEPGSVDAVFTVNDGGGLSVVEALAAAGRTEIVVATVDGDARSVQNILAGRLTRIDSAQFCGALGRETASVAWRVLQGERVPRMVLLPVFPITKETHELFLGWNQPPPQAFEKPWTSATPNWTWTLREVE